MPASFCTVCIEITIFFFSWNKGLDKEKNYWLKNCCWLQTFFWFRVIFSIPTLKMKNGKLFDSKQFFNKCFIRPPGMKMKNVTKRELLWAISEYHFREILRFENGKCEKRRLFRKNVWWKSFKNTFLFSPPKWKWKCLKNNFRKLFFIPKFWNLIIKNLKIVISIQTV